MSIELRILSGSRAGQSESYEKSVIAVGRHAMSDLRFDATQDLDVSTRHGEIRGIDGRYTVIDQDSTNGTFVNGERVPSGGERELRTGDVIAFGAHGPTVSVRISNSKTTPIGARVTAPVHPEPESPPRAQASQNAHPQGTQPQGARRPTTERVAIAVAEQTRGLKIAVAGAVILIGGLGAGAWWMGHREAAASEARLRELMTSYDSSSKLLQARLAATNDTALITNLQREKDSLVNLARNAKGERAAADARQAIQRHQVATAAIGEMDTPAVVNANNAAIALIRTELGDQAFEATGFGVGENGLVVTNRHAVDNGKTRASKVMIKFADTPTWRRAHVLRLPDDASVDLALLQIDEPGPFPTVRGVASDVDAPVGTPTASLGFPLGSELPMEGSSATSTLTIGIVSKTTSDLLQIDSYASHGSSGSPVFDRHGHVVGVIYGGPKSAGGRIVYAVPAQAITALIHGSR